MEKNTRDTKGYIRECLVKCLEDERNELLGQTEDKRILVKKLEEELSPKQKGIGDVFKGLFCYEKKGIEKLTEKQRESFKKIISKCKGEGENIIKKCYSEVKEEICKIKDEIKNTEKRIENIETKIILKTLSLHEIKKSDVKTNNYYFHFDYNSLYVDFVNQNERLCGEIYRKPRNEKEENYIRYIREIPTLTRDFLKNKEILEDKKYKEFDQFYELAANDHSRVKYMKLVRLGIKETNEELEKFRIPFEFYKSAVNEPFRESLFEFIKDNLINNFGEILQDCFKYRSFTLYGSPSKTTREVIKIANLPLEKVKKIQDKYMKIRIDDNETLEGKLENLQAPYNTKK